MKLQDAKALVTGGSQGIGFEIAILLKSHGATVCICGRDEKKLMEAAKQLDVIPVHGDVSSSRDVKGIVDLAVRSMGGINVLINNAGYGYFDQLTDMKFAKFEELLKTNVLGVMMMGQECSRHFIANQYGNIINISSTAGLTGFAGGTAYVASKFAVKGMTECWRAELRQHNIRVMLVNPSEVQTSFVTNSGREARAFNPTKLESKEIAHVVKSMLEMDDVGFITEATVFATNPKG